MPKNAYKMPPVQPIKAFFALKNLMADPQDTVQLARLTAALRGRSEANLYKRFRASPVGAKVLIARQRLNVALDDHATLAAMDENALGRHLLTFARQNNFSAEHLKDLTQDATEDLARAGEKVMIFADRMRDMHDFYHVLTGYGRDEFGEMCVLAFSYPQQKLTSFAAIVIASSLNFSGRLLLRGIWPAHVFGAVLDAFLAGKNAAWLPGEDLEAMLPEDIDRLRARLKIPEPVRYKSLLARLRAKTGWQNGIFFKPVNESANA